eukprot:scaffold8130_cov69-Phaeocystis_antarctica.AAC.13
MLHNKLAPPPAQGSSHAEAACVGLSDDEQVGPPVRSRREPRAPKSTVLAEQSQGHRSCQNRGKTSYKRCVSVCGQRFDVVPTNRGPPE